MGAKRAHGRITTGTKKEAPSGARCLLAWPTRWMKALLLNSLIYLLTTLLCRAGTGPVFNRCVLRLDSAKSTATGGECIQAQFETTLDLLNNAFGVTPFAPLAFRYAIRPVDLMFSNPEVPLLVVCSVAGLFVLWPVNFDHKIHGTVKNDQVKVS